MTSTAPSFWISSAACPGHENATATVTLAAEERKALALSLKPILGLLKLSVDAQLLSSWLLADSASVWLRNSWAVGLKPPGPQKS